MNTILNIKNFRIFDENGASFECNPITVLTGGNSSGKSSVVKAILLLNEFLAQIKKDVLNGESIELEKYKLDFSQYPNNLLGRFDKVIYDKSEDKTFSIGFSIYSLILSKDIFVEFVFSADENDLLNNAYLDRITISIDEEVFYSSSRSEPSYCNINLIKDEFVRFLLTEHNIRAYCGLISTYEFEDNMTENEYQSVLHTIKYFLRNVNKSRLNDILRHVRFSTLSNPIIETENQLHSIEQMGVDANIFAIPLLEKLEEIDKAEIESYINSHFLDNASDGLTMATKKILKAYTQSDYEKFSEFFQHFECQHLNHIVCKSGILKTNKNGIRILTPRQLALDCTFLTTNPFDTHSVHINIGESSKFIEQTKEEKEKEIQEWEKEELSFDLLYEIVMEWNRTYEKSMDIIKESGSQMEKPYVYEVSSPKNPTGSIYHITYQLLTKFATAVVTEAITPEWGSNMTYVSSSRASVNRLYTLDSKDNFSQLLQEYFERRRVFIGNNNNSAYYPKNLRYHPDSFMNRWIERFNIGRSISLNVDKEGLGVQILLHKTENDKGRLLADEGYGITQLVSILLQIETAILSARGKHINRNYGLDDLDKYEWDKFHYEVNTIAIEEPEIHLHPKFQSLLADMIAEAFLEYNIHFIVETHSEYLIRKLQLLVAEHEEHKKLEPSEISIYYINSDDDKSEQKVKRIGICSDGYLNDSFGEGFYDEATRLSRQLM